jgi:regulator of replication initiation timing
MNIPILGEIEKLINEHGSAVILKERIALVNDKYSALEKELSASKTKVSELEAENKSLALDNEKLRQEIQRRDNIIQDNKSHTSLLDENKIKLLIFLSQQYDRITIEAIVQSLNMNIQIATFHLEELEKSKMVHGLYYSGDPCDWILIQGGRRYLIENNLIS